MKKKKADKETKQYNLFTCRPDLKRKEKTALIAITQILTPHKEHQHSSHEDEKEQRSRGDGRETQQSATDSTANAMPMPAPIAERRGPVCSPAAVEL